MLRNDTSNVRKKQIDDTVHRHISNPLPRTYSVNKKQHNLVVQHK